LLKLIPDAVAGNGLNKVFFCCCLHEIKKMIPVKKTKDLQVVKNSFMQVTSYTLKL
jgi:hypothetical protein